MGEEFDPTVDYTKTGEYYERKNYKAFISNLDQNTITRMLADNIVGSKLVITNWEKQQLAENLTEIKFGKEKE
jgi:hypothetical protein